MNKAKNLKMLAILLVVIGLAVTLYNTFDGVKTATNIQNIGYGSFLIGLAILFLNGDMEEGNKKSE